MIADSSKPNKLRNVYTIRSTTRNVTIQKRKIYHIKIKVIALIINLEETNPFATERCRSKKGASVFEILALFNWINLIDHTFKIRVVNVQKVIEVPRSGIKSLDNISFIIMVKRIHGISFVAV